jgi:hypothetical protein
MNGPLAEYLVEARLADLEREFEAFRLAGLSRATGVRRPAPDEIPRQRRGFRPLGRFTRTPEAR